MSFAISSNGLGRLKVKTSPSDDSAAKVAALEVTFLIIGRLVRCGGRYPNPPLRGTGNLDRQLIFETVRKVDLHNLKVDVMMETNDLERIDQADHGVVLHVSIR